MLLIALIKRPVLNVTYCTCMYHQCIINIPCGKECCDMIIYYSLNRSILWLYISIFIHNIYVFIICMIVFTSYFSNYLLSKYLLYLYQSFWHIFYWKSCHHFSIFYLCWVLWVRTRIAKHPMYPIKRLYGHQSTQLFNLFKKWYTRY